MNNNAAKSVENGKFDVGLIHIAVACLLLPGYFLYGYWFKVLVFPYILYLVFSRSARNFPALLIHFIPGSMVNPSLLLACSVLGIFRFEDLLRYRLGTMFSIALAGLTVLGYVVMPEILEGDLSLESLIDRSQYLSIYLGIFSFFYGVLISHGLNRRIINRVAWVLLFSILAQVSGYYEGTIRYIFLAIPFFLTIVIIVLLDTRRAEVSLLFRMMPVIVFALIAGGGLSLTFVLSLSSILAMGFIIALLYKMGFEKAPVGKVLGVAAILATTYLVNSDRSFLASEDSKSIRDIRGIDDLISAIKYKAFGDRGALWAGAWEGIKSENNFWPPSTPPLISYEASVGKEAKVTFGAHNIGLEMLRLYGFFVGFLGLSVYLLFVGHMSRVVLSNSFDPIASALSAAVLATACVGGVFGHFVLGNNFSFLLFGLGGALYGANFKPRFSMRGIQ